MKSLLTALALSAALLAGVTAASAAPFGGYPAWAQHALTPSN